MGIGKGGGYIAFCVVVLSKPNVFSLKFISLTFTIPIQNGKAPLASTNAMQWVKRERKGKEEGKRLKYEPQKPRVWKRKKRDDDLKGEKEEERRG